MNEATNITLPQLIDRAERELPKHKRAEVENAYNRAFWFAAGWHEATMGRGDWNAEQSFAVAYTLATLDYLTERVCFRASLVGFWNEHCDGGVA